LEEHIYIYIIRHFVKSRQVSFLFTNDIRPTKLGCPIGLLFPGAWKFAIPEFLGMKPVKIPWNGNRCADVQLGEQRVSEAERLLSDTTSTSCRRCSISN